jgi:hypothetical protein
MTASNSFSISGKNNNENLFHRKAHVMKDFYKELRLDINSTKKEDRKPIRQDVPGFLSDFLQYIKEAQMYG